MNTCQVGFLGSALKGADLAGSTPPHRVVSCLPAFAPSCPVLCCRLSTAKLDLAVILHLQPFFTLGGAFSVYM